MGVGEQKAGDEAGGAPEGALEALDRAKRAFQEHLNARAHELALRRKLGVEVVEVDGRLGPKTHELAHRVVWSLGLQQGRVLPTPLPRRLQELIADPARRTAEQVGRARRREWNLGSDDHRDPLVLMRGVRMLQLIGDWDQWIHRRVEHVSMWPDDVDVFVRKRTVDFTLRSVAPSDAGAAPPAEGTLAAAVLEPPCPVPLTFARKWRLPHFDIRDESGRTLPLFTRDEYGPLSVAVLIAFGYQTCGYGLPGLTGDPLPRIPREIEEELRGIVHSDPTTAQTICNLLGSLSVGADTPPEQAGEVARWRRALSTSRPFMELANQFARSFPLMVWYQGKLDERRVVKISYHVSGERSPIEEIERDRVGSIHTRSWPQTGDVHASAVGHLALTVVCETLETGTLTDTSPPDCADVRLTQPLEASTRDGEGVASRVQAGGRWIVANLPVGQYQLHVQPLSGFVLESPHLCTLELAADEWRTVSVICRQVHRSEKRPAPPADGWREHLLWRIGLRPQPLLFPIRIGDGGGYHFEFEAPAGMRVTRGKVVGRRGRLDLNPAANQQTHLYVPQRDCEPGTAHALVHLRPTGEVILRSAMLTAQFAAAAILMIALHWSIAHSAGRSGIAVLLAVPGGLAAYVSQAAPSRVTDERLLGIRMLALGPGLLAFAAAAIVLLGNRSWVGLALLWAVEALALGAAAMLTFVHRFARRPPELSPKPKERVRG
jgi:hypothetical protein